MCGCSDSQGSLLRLVQAGSPRAELLSATQQVPPIRPPKLSLQPLTSLEVVGTSVVRDHLKGSVLIRSLSRSHSLSLSLSLYLSLLLHSDKGQVRPRTLAVCSCETLRMLDEALFSAGQSPLQPCTLSYVSPRPLPAPS